MNAVFRPTLDCLARRVFVGTLRGAFCVLGAVVSTALSFITGLPFEFGSTLVAESDLDKTLLSLILLVIHER
jgi:hypothetical protein